MELQDIISDAIDRYEQNFLVVHVVSDGFYETFMITKLDRNFVPEKCYNVPTFIDILKSRNIVPKKIGLTNTPFACVTNWKEIS